MKHTLQKIERFCGTAAAWLIALTLFGLAAASLFARMDLLDVTALAEGKTLTVGFFPLQIAGAAVLAALLLVLCVVLRRCKEQHTANCIITAAAAAELLLALWWVLSQQIYPANDQITVWQMAEALASGDFSAYGPESYGYTYFQTCPYQGTMALFMEPFIRLFGSGALRAWSVFGAACAPVCLLALCAIARELGAAPSVQVLCAVLCLLFVPIPMYASFVYGTLPAPALALWGGYGALRYARGGKPRWLLLPLALFSLAVLAYQSALIFMIAVCITVFFSGFAGSPKRLAACTVAAVLLLAVPLGVQRLCQDAFFARVPIPYSTGMPASATVLMGIHSGTYYGPGGFDGSSWALFQENGNDTAAANAAAGRAIRAYLATYLHEPKEVKFFLQKTAWQWLDPWFEALTMNGPSITAAGGAGWLPKALAGGVLFAPVQAVLRALLTAGYLFAGIGTLVLSRRSGGAVRVQLPGIAFLGGFLFQLVWETKSRYCFPFFMFLLPVAAAGIAAAAQWLVQRQGTDTAK